MRCSVQLLCLSMGALLASGCASEPQTATTEEHVDVIATVRAVDTEQGLIGIESSTGQRLVVQVAPEVKNAAEVRPGDRVRVRHSQAIAAQVVKAAQPQVLNQSERSETNLEPGAAPSATTERETKALFRLEGVDTRSNAVMLTGPDGLQRVIHVRSAEMSDYIRSLEAGDTVEVTYTEALAISIEPME